MCKWQGVLVVGEIKQVIVVRKDLHMRKGKMCAQVAHASMKVILDKMAVMPNGHGRTVWSLGLSHKDPMYKWLVGPFTKIVLYVPDLDYMLNLKDRADSLGVPTALIIDIGKTEFNNKPTATALALGPYDADVLKELTVDLQLI